MMCAAYSDSTGIARRATQVDGQLHAPSALRPAKEFWHPMYEAG